MKRNLMLTEADINKIVNESINKLLYEGQWNNIERGKNMITLSDGTKISEKEYKKMMKEKNKQKQSKSSKVKTPSMKSGNEVDPNQLHNILEKFIKVISVQNGVKSLATFKDHAYRSYGTDAKELIGLFDIPLNKFSVAYIKTKQQLRKVEQYGRSNEYAAYEEARRLAYAIEDMNEALKEVYNEVQTKMPFIKQKYGMKPVFQGRGGNKELGFKHQLICKNARSFMNTYEQINDIAKEIQDIADKGRNPMDYDPRTGRFQGRTFK